MPSPTDNKTEMVRDPLVRMLRDADPNDDASMDRLVRELNRRGFWREGMVKWEYMETTVIKQGQSLDPGQVAIYSELNELGEEGWEIVSYQGLGNQSAARVMRWSVLLKRRKLPDPEI